MSSTLFSIFILAFSTLAGASVFYKAFLHDTYYEEILNICGKNSFRSEANNIFTGRPLWKQKKDSDDLTPEMRFEFELFTPVFSLKT